MANHIPGPLYVHQHGTVGIPMLFIHSTPDDHRLWLYQSAHFSNWYRTFAVDLAGYGRSPSPMEGLTIGDHAAACWEIIDAHTSDKIILQGNSVGSHVAMHMATQRPERTLAMILSGCGYLPKRDPMIRWKQRYQEEGLPLRHTQVLDHFSPPMQERPHVRHYAAMVTEINNLGTVQSIIATNHALLDAEPDSFFEEISVPTMIISGSADRNHASSFELAKRIPGCYVETVEDAGHSCNMEKPWDFDAYCIEFLKKLDLFPG